MKRHNFWTPEEDAILQQRWEEMLSRREIAYEIGRSPDSISQRAKTLGLPGRQFMQIEQPGAYTSDKAFTLDDDAGHVALVLAHGGFPTMVMLDGKSVWVWPNLRQREAA